MLGGPCGRHRRNQSSRCGCRSKRCHAHGAELDVEPVAEVVAAALVAPRRMRRREPPGCGRAGRPTAATRGRRRVPSPRLTTTSLRGASPRQPHATSSCHVSFPSQPRRSASCQSPSRRTGSPEAAEQAVVEPAELGIGRLGRAAAEEDGQPDAAARRAGPRRPGGRPVWVERGHGGGAGLGRRERGGGARLVVVLDEAHQLALVGDVAAQVAAHRLGVVGDEPVVEALVVAVVEALLLERVLEIPVRLRQERRSRRGVA